MRKYIGKIKNKTKAKEYRRKLVIRKKVDGAAETPRLCAIKTNKHLQVQVIDDVSNKTLFSVQTFGKNKATAKANKEGAKILGAQLAEMLKKKKITSAVFDRNGKQYTGVIAQVATSLRENGINI